MVNNFRMLHGTIQSSVLQISKVFEGYDSLCESPVIFRRRRNLPKPGLDVLLVDYPSFVGEQVS